MVSISGFTLRAALFAGILASSALVSAHAGGFALVANANDSCPGSLRAAIEVQQANIIVIPKNVGDISIDTTLTYRGAAEVPVITL